VKRSPTELMRITPIELDEKLEHARRAGFIAGWRAGFLGGHLAAVDIMKTGAAKIGADAIIAKLHAYHWQTLRPALERPMVDNADVPEFLFGDETYYQAETAEP